MTTYNGLLGYDRSAPMVLDILDFQPQQFVRFRDAWIADVDELAVYTTLGGWRRSAYHAVFEVMEKHPHYLRAVDDTVDTAFCTFYFSVPEPHRAAVATYVEDNGKGETGDERWFRRLQALTRL